MIPSAYVPTMNQIEAKLNAKSELRMAEKKAGPVVTDNGNFLLDVKLQWEKIPSEELDSIDVTLLRLAGVVHTGFFLSMVNVAYVSFEDGAVKKLEK